MEDLELRESAAKVVKATTTSFPLTPPFNGFMEDSGSSIRSYSSTLISTPIARSETMQIQEDEIQWFAEYFSFKGDGADRHYR